MSKKILIVEDDKSFREVVSEFLESYGFEVLTASDGEEGVLRFNRDNPDLVLADVLMPKTNGFVMTEQIRKTENGAAVPIVLMSALYKTAKIQKDNKDKYSLVDYFVKPFNLKDAAHKLSKALGVTKEGMLAERMKKTESVRQAVATESEKNKPTPPIGDAPEKGDIAAYPPPFALMTFYRKRVTGIATFLKSGVTKKAYLRNGEVIYATSTQAEEAFSQLMINDGVVTSEQMDAALTKSKANGILLGKVLTGDGIVEEKILADYLIREVRHRLDDLLAWTTGSYEFEADESFIGKIRRPSLRILNFIYRYSRNGGLDEVFRARYEGYFDATVKKSEERLSSVGEVDWIADELLTIALVDGLKSVRKLLSESGYARTEFFRIIGLLEYAGVLHLL